VAVPASFQAILNQLSSPLEATVTSGLNAALNLNKQPLEGNAYKDQLIAPLCNILNSGKFSTDTTSLALENLEMIATNDKININDKVDIVIPLLNFMEKSATWTEKDLVSFTYSLTSIIENPDTPQAVNDMIASRLFADESPLWYTPKGITYTLFALESYLATTNSDINIKNQIVDYLLNELSGLDQSYTTSGIEAIIKDFGCALQDSRLDNTRKTNIVNIVLNVFNKINPEYPAKRATLAVLMVVQNDSSIDLTIRNNIKEVIVKQGVTSQNETIWNKYKVLVLIDPDIASQVNASVLQEIDKSLADTPEINRPFTIALQDTINDYAQQQNEDKSNIGNYETSTHLVILKINDAVSYDPKGLFHEISHYTQQEHMTKEEKDLWDQYWTASSDLKDFARKYGDTNKNEDLATIMEAVMAEHNLPDSQKTVYNRAKEQALAGDSTLMNKYIFGEKKWGFS